MAAFKPESQNRSSSPSPVGLLRRHRSVDSGAAYSPGHRNPTRYAIGDRYRREMPSVSPFERSGGITTTINQNYKKFAQVGDDHVTYYHDDCNDDDDNDDDWLEEELRNRSGKSTTEGGAEEQATVADQKWQGLGGAEDRMIPWPPMVVVLNTRLSKMEGSDKWVGIRNRDLLECFKEYEPIKAWSPYNSHGHCGVSLLIFDSSIFGYHQAERVHNHFKGQRRGKYEWHKEKPWKQQTTECEKRLLYGYMATKEEDLTMISNHHGDKQKLKFDMKSYQMVVGNPMRELYEASQKQPMLTKEIEIEQSKYLYEKLRQRELEIEATMRKVTEQSVEHKEEIESLREICDKLSSKLKESEASLDKMKECSSSPHAAGDDHHEAGSSGLENKVNFEDGEHNSPDNKKDEITEEKHYLGTCDSEEKKNSEERKNSEKKKKKRPLLWGFF